MESYTFEDVVGGRDRFFSEHFDKRTLLRKGALADQVDSLISLRQLDDILALETVTPAYLRVAKDGKGVSPKAYTRTGSHPGVPLVETVAPEKVYELFRSGGTVTWNSLEQIVPAVRRLTDVFADEFACDSEAVAFLTPAGNDGYAPHHDPVDVFVLQLEGTKAWNIWSPPADRSSSEATYAPEQLGPPDMETLLEPGDVLYLPYGTPHAAAAKDSMSLHISIIVRRKSWRDLVLETVRELLDTDDFNGFPHLGDGSGRGVLSAQLSDKLNMARDQLATVDVVAEAQRLVALGRGTVPREFERLSQLDSIGPETKLRRSASPVTIEEGGQGRSGLIVNGHKVTVPKTIASMVRELDSGGDVTAEHFLSGESPVRSVSAAQGLARLGVLDVVADEG